MTECKPESAPDRTLIEVAGPDREQFLQGIVTNDVGRLAGGLVYAAILTPQGKFTADFFLVPTARSILIDVDSGCADQVESRLRLYKLRAKVEISRTNVEVCRGTCAQPPNALPDPRHPALGWRSYGEDCGSASEDDWDAIRVRNCIPKTLVELLPDQTYILEAGFERLNGVDFRKGCYVGQEVTARMRHKAKLRKGLVTVQVQGEAPVGTSITCGSRTVGTLFSQSAGTGIAYLRFDWASKGPLRAGKAKINWQEQPGG